MIKILLHVQGMMCPHCEARVNQAVREAFSVERVDSSHKKGITTVICAYSVEPGDVKAVVEAAGYAVAGIEIKRKGFLGLWV